MPKEKTVTVKDKLLESTDPVPSGRLKMKWFTKKRTIKMTILQIKFMFSCMFVKTKKQDKWMDANG